MEQLDPDRIWRNVLDVLASKDWDVISAHFEDQSGNNAGTLWRQSPDQLPVPPGTDAIVVRESFWVRGDDCIEEDIDGLMQRLKAVHGISLEIEDRSESRYLVVRLKRG